MCNSQHMFVRFVAVAVLVVLHWFPHSHAAPQLVSSTAARSGESGETAANAGNSARSQHLADAEPVVVSTIP
jgi:hypothetical protein